MARRLIVTPSGVDEQREVSLDPPYQVGMNRVVIQNDQPETVADGTYTAMES